MGKREENKRKKRQAILDAGIAEFLRVGFDAGSIETIVREAGVARGTFYLYFPDKVAVLRAGVTPWTEALLASIAVADLRVREAQRPGDALDAYTHMGTEIALYAMAHAGVAVVALRENRSPGPAGVFLRSEEDRILSAVTAMTENARDRGLIEVEEPAVVVRVIFGAIERLTFDFFTGRPVGDPLVLAAQVVRLFTRGMGLAPEQ